MSAHILITAPLAIAIGELAASDQPNTVKISYRDDRPENEWFVTLDKGYGTLTYIIDDETGEHRPAGLGEHA